MFGWRDGIYRKSVESGVWAYRHTGDAEIIHYIRCNRLAKPRYGLKSKPVSQKQTIALKL